VPLHRAGLAALPRGSARPQPTQRRVGDSRDGAVQPAQPGSGRDSRAGPAQGPRPQCARNLHADDSPSACQTARAATPNLRRDDAKTTKHPGKGRDSRLSPPRRRLASLALPPHCSSPPLSPGPIASSSLGRRRTRSGPAAGPPQGTIRFHKRTQRLYRERPRVDRSVEQLTVCPAYASKPRWRTRPGPRFCPSGHGPHTALAPRWLIASALAEGCA